MEDETIIGLFFARSEQAIGELDGKYGKTCRRLSFNIVNSREDAEECVNDAYLGAWNTIPPARPNPLRAYICKIVRNISLKCYERKRAAKRGSAYEVAMGEIEQTFAGSTTPEEVLEAKELAALIEGFLEEQSKENRVIFMLRYAYLEPYADIAARVGLSEKTVSVRLTRMRGKLRQYLTERGVTV